MIGHLIFNRNQIFFILRSCGSLGMRNLKFFLKLKYLLANQGLHAVGILLNQRLLEEARDIDILGWFHEVIVEKGLS